MESSILMNLFSIFDPVTGFLSLNWVCLCLFVFMMPLSYWVNLGRINFFLKMVFNLVLSDVKSVLSKSSGKSVVIFMMYFILIMSMNLMGLISYVFTGTSHLVINLILSLPIWGSFVCYGWFMKNEEMFGHLIPDGTPLALSVFMVYIETISSLIRPVTLSVRLTANMIAGHLILSLISGVVESYLSLFVVVSGVMVVLMILEICVALIQSYVFVILITLYSSEVV